MDNPSKQTPLEKFRNLTSIEANRITVMEAAPSRIAGYGPASVIDIGSNSVRLVSYERLSRSPTPVFNEKALCGLGRGLADTGLLDEEAVESAIAAIHRFKVISDQLKSSELFILATAAARDAKNGAEFIERVREISGTEPMVLSGADEAHYSGFGVISGICEANGVIGDLGGGSLEIANVSEEIIEEGVTFPLGGLRLKDMSGNSPKRAFAIAETHLAQNAVLAQGKGRVFYAIGGTWRSLAHLYMCQNPYPLHVLHHYTMEASGIRAFCKILLESDLEKIKGIEVVSKNRIPLLKYGAAVLLALVKEMQPSRIVISALGIREGFLYSRLQEDERQRDPLIEGARELSLLRSRSPQNTEELVDWTSSLYTALGWAESSSQERLRIAACLLSDVGWRAHPDYRGLQSINTIAHAAFIGIDHPGRAFVALCAFFRHEGQLADEELPDIARLLTPDMLKRARLLGLAFKTSHMISASMAGFLGQSRFHREEDHLLLVITQEQVGHVGERLMRRLGQIGKLTDLSVDIRVEDW